MYKSRFITCNKSPTLLQDVDSGRGCACVRTGFTWQLSVLSATFFYEPKTTLKYKVKKKKKDSQNVNWMQSRSGTTSYRNLKTILI